MTESLQSFADRTSEVDALREANLKLAQQLTQAKARTERLVSAALQGAQAAITALGPIQPVAAPKADKRTRGAEAALWHLTDWQLSKTTPSYNSEIAQQRVMRFCEKAARITEVQRADHPVKECVIAFGGDMLEGLFNFPCVDTETEALTPEGWVRLDDLQDKEILVFDSGDGTVHYERPVEVFQKHYIGPMYQYGGSKVDHLVTPHHRMYVKSRKEHSYVVKRACEYGTGANWYQTSGQWSEGTWAPPMVRQNKYGQDWQWDCDPDDLATFVGWFVTEGSAHSGEVFISQSQSANPEKWQSIDLLLKRMVSGIPRMRRSGSGYGATAMGFRICSTALAMWMKEQFKPGDAATAYLPDWVRNAPVAQLEALLQAIILGDGHYMHPGSTDTAQVFTISRQFADDVQEVAMKLGFSTHIGTRNPRRWRIRGQEGPARLQYVVTLSRQERTAKRVSEVEYEGTVWCPKVSTGLWVARRNGKVIVTGNTQAFEIDQTLFGQLVTTARLEVDVVRFALSLYDHVTVVAEPGNHGRIGNKSAVIPKSDNADRFAYELARQQLVGEHRLTWDPNHGKEDIQRIEIGNYRCLLIHGDEVGRGGFASPGTILQHVNRWKAGAYIVDGAHWDFTDCYVGHYHNHSQQALADGDGAVFWTGSTESENHYARDTMAASGRPSQRLHFIDLEAGRVTAEYRVRVD